MLMQMTPIGQFLVNDPYLPVTTSKKTLTQERVARISQAVADENWFAPLPEKQKVIARS